MTNDEMKGKLAEALARLDTAEVSLDREKDDFNAEVAVDLASKDVWLAKTAIESVFAALGGAKEDVLEAAYKQGQEAADEAQAMHLKHADPEGNA